MAANIFDDRHMRILIQRRAKLNFHVILFARCIYLAGIYSKTTMKSKTKICSKLTKKTPEQLQSRCSGIFIVNFKQILYILPVFPFSSLNKLMPAQ